MKIRMNADPKYDHLRGIMRDAVDRVAKWPDWMVDGGRNEIARERSNGSADCVTESVNARR